VTGVIAFDVSLNWDIAALLVLTVLVSMSAVGPGLIITSLAMNAEAAGSIQTVVAIPLQFFTGSFFPLFMLPPAGQAFALALPYTQYSMAVTDIMVRGLRLADVGFALLYITVVGVALMVIGVFTYHRALRRI
ncbi:MAG: ABC transporter permease, partial [Candidatus Thorarchaeota archaeon]